ELAEIERALDLARQGRGHVVAVVGDPGVGKSRLFYEMKPLLARDSLLLETSCVAHGKATPYLPLISLLHSYFEIRHEDDEATRREKLRLKVVSLDPALEGTLPYLHHLLGVAEPAASLRQMDPRIRRQRFFAQGILDRGASGISLARALADLQIPATVQGVLAARIDRLRVDQKNLLHTLAVIGPEFDLRLIERVAGPLDEGISELLTHLADQKFIDEAVVAEQPGYRFKHALTQEVAYNSLLRERRRVVHEEVAQAIEALFA